MNIEAKIKELEEVANKLEGLLEEKDRKIKELTSKNSKLESQVAALNDVIFYMSKNKTINSKTDADLSEYARNLARRFAGRIRSDEERG